MRLKDNSGRVSEATEEGGGSVFRAPAGKTEWRGRSRRKALCSGKNRGDATVIGWGRGVEQGRRPAWRGKTGLQKGGAGGVNWEEGEGRRRRGFSWQQREEGEGLPDGGRGRREEAAAARRREKRAAVWIGGRRRRREEEQERGLSAAEQAGIMTQRSRQRKKKKRRREQWVGDSREEETAEAGDVGRRKQTEEKGSTGQRASVANLAERERRKMKEKRNGKGKKKRGGGAVSGRRRKSRRRRGGTARQQEKGEEEKTQGERGREREDKLWESTQIKHNVSFFQKLQSVYKVQHTAF